MQERVHEDAFNMLCGHKLGEGSHRTVFECKIRPDLVVKVENQELRYFANVLEDIFWSENQYDKRISKWLAPCEFLSPDGRILLQKKCDKIPKSFKLPEKIPSFLTDLKVENFGLLNGKIVCIDYAIVINNPSNRLVKSHIYR